MANKVRFRARSLAVVAAMAACGALAGCGGNAGDGSGDSEPDAEQADGGSEVQTSSDEVGITEAEMSDPAWRTGDPTEWDDVEIFHPRKLENVEFDMNKSTVTDLDTGDSLIITHSGYEGAPSGFSYRNDTTGPIAAGSFKTWGSQQEEVFAVTGISLPDDEFRAMRAREEYDISRLAEMFRAMREAGYRKLQPNSKTGWNLDITVVDARPGKISEINPQNGTRKAAQ